MAGLFSTLREFNLFPGKEKGNLKKNKGFKKGSGRNNGETETALFAWNQENMKFRERLRQSIRKEFLDMLKSDMLTTVRCRLYGECSTVTACINFICLSSMEMNMKNWRRK